MDGVERGHRAAVAPVEIAEQLHLSAERAGVRLRHDRAVGQRDRAGQIVFPNDLLQRVTAEEIQFVAILRRALGELEEMNVSYRDARRENTVRQKVEAHC